MTNHIAHFEIFASDVERARKFYEKVFAWRFEVGGRPDFDVSRRITTRTFNNSAPARRRISTRRQAAAEEAARRAR